MQNRIIRLLIIVGSILCVMAHHAAWAAPKWYEYYTEAQRASDKKEWERAIEFYLKAIKDDPVPSKKKNYGMRYTAYYPYLGVGIAYLATGKMEEALKYCQLAQEKGVEPEKPVNDCVNIASKYVKVTPMAAAPTATPEPPRQENAPPSLSLTAPLPESTDEKIIDIKGIASGVNGIKEINVSVENLGVTTVSRFEMTKKQEESFWIGLPIYFGQNNVTVEAVDLNDQVAFEQFSVVRNRSGETVVAKATAIPAIKKATPTPIPVRQDTPVPTLPSLADEDTTIPTITLTSKIPEETDTQELLISGVANDDGGMDVVRVSVGLADSKGLILSSAESAAENEQQTLLTFQQSITLEPGKNRIRIEAIDVKGNVATREMTIVRTSADRGSEATASVIPGQRYAVIIGIGAYQDQRLNLSYTVNDAQGLYDVLTDPKFGAIQKENVQLLLSEEATTVNIKKAIGTWLRRVAKEEDTVIIYYSGHGAPEGDETYWVTYDADIDDLYSTALSNRSISDMLGRVSAKRLITFLDSCYSAATVNRSNQSRNIPTEIPLEKFTGEGRIVISASNGKELSLELDEYKHGIFTYYLLEGLKGSADRNEDGIIEVDEIWNFVQRQVRDKAQAEGNDQTPVIQGNMTAGIALTMNMDVIQEKERKQSAEAQIQQLIQWFDSGELDERHFDCAVGMLEDGKSNRTLEALLKGTIGIKTFNRTFRCE